MTYTQLRNTYSYIYIKVCVQQIFTRTIQTSEINIVNLNFFLLKTTIAMIDSGRLLSMQTHNIINKA